MANEPSIFNVSLCKSIVISSSCGTSHSKTTLPEPFRHRLNNPSSPIVCPDTLLIIDVLKLTLVSDAQYKPSSTHIAPFQSSRSSII